MFEIINALINMIPTNIFNVFGSKKEKEGPQAVDSSQGGSSKAKPPADAGKNKKQNTASNPSSVVTQNVADVSSPSGTTASPQPAKPHRSTASGHSPPVGNARVEDIDAIAQTLGSSERTLITSFGELNNSTYVESHLQPFYQNLPDPKNFSMIINTSDEQDVGGAMRNKHWIAASVFNGQVYLFDPKNSERSRTETRIVETALKGLRHFDLEQVDRVRQSQHVIVQIFLDALDLEKTFNLSDLQNNNVNADILKQGAIWTEMLALKEGHFNPPPGQNTVAYLSERWHWKDDSTLDDTQKTNLMLQFEEAIGVLGHLHRQEYAQAGLKGTYAFDRNLRIENVILRDALQTSADNTHCGQYSLLFNHVMEKTGGDIQKTTNILNHLVNHRDLNGNVLSGLKDRNFRAFETALKPVIDTYAPSYPPSPSSASSAPSAPSYTQIASQTGIKQVSRNPSLSSTNADAPLLMQPNLKASSSSSLSASSSANSRNSGAPPGQNRQEMVKNIASAFFKGYADLDPLKNKLMDYLQGNDSQTRENRAEKAFRICGGDSEKINALLSKILFQGLDGALDPKQMTQEQRSSIPLSVNALHQTLKNTLGSTHTSTNTSASDSSSPIMSRLSSF